MRCDHLDACQLFGKAVECVHDFAYLQGVNYVARLETCFVMDTLLSTFRPSDAASNGFLPHNGDLENVHRDAKHMICMYLVEPIREMFDNMYRIVLSKGGSLKDFQKCLQAIPKWNVNVLDEHCNAIRSRCEGLSDIVSALFLERIKVLSVLRVCHDDSPVSIKIPSETRFCHRVFEKCAEEFYTDPFMFRRNNDRAKNGIILSAIDSTVQRLLPIKDVLAVYMKAPMEKQSSDSDHDHAHVEKRDDGDAAAAIVPKVDDIPDAIELDSLAKLKGHNVNVQKLDGDGHEPGSPARQGQYFENHDFAEDAGAGVRPASPRVDIAYPHLVHAGHGGGHGDAFLFDRGDDADLDALPGE